MVGSFLSVDGPLGTQVAVCVPGVVDVGDDQAVAGVGGVDELAVADVDAHMEDAAGFAAAGEEQQIAGEQLTKLMTLGLTEKEAEEEIVNGFLK